MSKKTTTAPKAKAKATSNGSMKGNQVKVLAYLAKAKSPVSRAVIAEKTGIDLASLTGYIGPVDPVKRAYNDSTYFTTLVTFGYVKHVSHESETGKEVILNAITPAGRKALEKAMKEQTAKA